MVLMWNYLTYYNIRTYLLGRINIFSISRRRRSLHTLLPTALISDMRVDKNGLNVYYNEYNNEECIYV
jgi:hypothetical protein